MKPLLVAALVGVLGCAHASQGEEEQVHRLPIRVAGAVLASPTSSAPRAQLLRDALLLAMLDQGFCLDRRGDFEAWLHVSSAMDANGEDVVTVTIDDGKGSQIDEVSERVSELPSSMTAAGQAVRPLLRDLAQSAALRELATSSNHGPCAPAQ
jgi:hypothetical protein